MFSRICFLLVASLFIAASAQGQSRDTVNPSESMQTTYIAGAPAHVLSTSILLNTRPQLITQTGGGAGAADASRLQGPSLNMTSLGASTSAVTGYRLAEDFVVPAAGWKLSDVTVYAYQPGSTTTSTFNSFNFRIWNGDPRLPTSTVVFGDNTTNRLSNSAFTYIWRDTETTVGASNRPIMGVTASGLSIHLPAGTYWLDYQLGGTLASGTFAPPLTISGQTTSGNALQFDSANSIWDTFTDGGSATGQGFPISFAGVPASADLVIRAVPDSDMVDIGNNVSFESTVRNLGPGNAAGIVATVTLPMELTYVSNSCGASFATPTLTWTIGTIANAAAASCTITAKVSRGGWIGITQRVTSELADLRPADNVSSAYIFGGLMTEIPMASARALLVLLAGLLAIGLYAGRRY